MKRVFIILCLLFSVAFCVAEEVKFEEDEVSSWYRDVDKFRGLSDEERNVAWKSAEKEIKDLSIETLITKIRIEKRVGDEKVGSLKVSGFDGLTWNEDGTIGDGKENGVKVDLEKIPSSVVGIVYTEEEGFSYEYEGGGKVNVKRGMIDENSYLIDESLNMGVGEGERKIKLDLGPDEKGEIDINENGEFGIKNGANVKVGERSFLSALGDEGSLVVGKNRFEIKNLDVRTEKLNMNILKIEGDEVFHLIFEEPKDGEYDEIKNGAWIYDNSAPDASTEELNVKMRGKNVVIDFKESWVDDREKPKNIIVEGDGEGLVFRLEKTGDDGVKKWVDFGIDGEKTYVPRNVGDLEDFEGSFDLTNKNQKAGEDGEIPVYHYGDVREIVVVAEEDSEGIKAIGDEEPKVAIVSVTPEAKKPVVEVVEPVKKPAALVCIGKFCDVGNAISLVTGETNQVPYDYEAGIGEKLVTKTQIYAREDELDEMLKTIPKGLSKEEFGGRATKFLKNNKIVTVVAGDVITKDKIDANINKLLGDVGLPQKEINRIENIKVKIYGDLSERTTGSLMWKKQEFFVPVNSRIIILSNDDGSKTYGLFSIRLNGKDHELKIPESYIENAIHDKYKIYGTEERPMTLDELYYGKYGAKKEE